jgi:hypothetical protein
VLTLYAPAPPPPVAVIEENTEGLPGAHSGPCVDPPIPPPPTVTDALLLESVKEPAKYPPAPPPPERGLDPPPPAITKYSTGKLNVVPFLDSVGVIVNEVVSTLVKV